MKIWDYFCYLDHRGNNVITDWLKGLSKKAQANLKRSLEILECLEIENWHKPNPASLTKNHIYVIRFKDENRKQWRIYGHHNVEKRAFVLSYYGFEKDNKYEPAVEQCVAECANRMEQCSANWDSRTCSCLSTTNTPPNDPSNCGEKRLAG